MFVRYVHNKINQAKRDIADYAMVTGLENLTASN